MKIHSFYKTPLNPDQIYVKSYNHNIMNEFIKFFGIKTSRKLAIEICQQQKTF